MKSQTKKNSLRANNEIVPLYSTSNVNKINSILDSVERKWQEPGNEENALRMEKKINTLNSVDLLQKMNI
jgi:hypothetical protein